MYRQVFTPDNSKLILQLPKEFVGKLVEVLAFTVDEVQAKDEQHSWDNAKKFFNAKRISLKGFRFDRDEANER
ncbi:MAG: hypothetical protein K9J06_08845 [Flavobacteriales bacterium]|nr:hypothetical protein [Flavobacteriales bacterium]